VRALQKTLVIIAFLLLATQAVHNAYLLWLEPQQSVFDKDDRPTKIKIAQAASLEELINRYDVIHKEAEETRQDEMKAGKEPPSKQIESEPFKSELELKNAINNWESQATEVREVRFYWFAGLGFLIIGALVYAKWNQWLGLTLSIIAFTEFIYWTYSDEPFFYRTRQLDRLLANKLAFAIVSIVLLLMVIHLQGIFNKKAEV
jgi:hypothetical protein